MIEKWLHDQVRAAWLLLLRLLLLLLRSLLVWLLSFWSYSFDPRSLLNWVRTMMTWIVKAKRFSFLAAINSTSSSSTSGSTDVVAWTTACSNYTELNDPTRSVFATGYPLNCDNTAPFSNRTSSVWIRFTGTGGTILPLTTPGMNICGSEGTGWYSGTMPSSGEIINGTACFTWYNSVCRFSQAISVANCGSYYTYYLPPVPACMSRYCTI